jgi:holo-[acyl-carrier protein] synthase
VVTGVGTDIIEVNRIRENIERHPRFCERILTAAERDICSNGGDPAQRVAGRFAAKEAVAKALGRSLSWHDVEILSDEHGCPVVRLTGRALSVAAGRRIMVSISHCHSHAVAYAVAEREG